MKSFKPAIEVAGLPDLYSIHKAKHIRNVLIT
jgi:hypothetical protein